ncbi:MAG: hypothetical protein HOO86_01450 [Bacteroidales bacterium]|nr:hypothetical protein [Bacteroidales bacterium]
MPIISSKKKKIHVNLKFGNLLVIILLAMSLISCSKSLSREEGQKYLRAFDNEFIQLATRINKTDAAGSMEALSVLPDVPLPFLIKNERDITSGLGAYNFEKAKGKYLFSKGKTILDKEGESDSVCVTFPFKSKNDSLAQFILKQYSESPTSLQMMFPEVIEASIVAKNKVLANISYRAILKHDLPADAEMDILFSDFQINISLETSFQKSHGTITVKLKVMEDNKPMLTGTVVTEVKVTSDKTLVYNDKTMEFEIFPVKIYFQSEQDFTNSKADHFIENFNEKSVFTIYTHSGDKIGDVFLARIDGRDRLNMHIRYSDGYVENLEDLLLSIRKILNFKLVYMKPYYDGELQACQNFTLP